MLTTKQAAHILCVGDFTIRRYIREGVGKEKEKLKAIHTHRGRRLEYRIKLEDLENFRKKWLS